MQPVFYSEKMAQVDQKGWMRSGENITYYKSVAPSPGKPNTTYYGLAFNVTFPYDDDSCYLAYHFPYTFTDLQVFLDSVQRNATTAYADLYFERQILCTSDAGNVIDLITLTSKLANESKSPESSWLPLEERQYVFITARVHPGESNSSYIMEGFLHFLAGCSEEAVFLRNRFVFKIVPMLNPDGVIEGK